MEKENENNIQVEKVNKSKYINLSIILIIFIGLIIYMLKVDGLDNIIDVIKSIDITWLFGGLVCMIIYWICESICLYIPTKKIYKKQKFSQSFRVSMIGQLFNCITPFSSGGQPMQAYEMVKEGKSLSNSFTALLIKFIVFQTTLVLYTAVVMIFQFSYFKQLISNFVVLAIIGFAVNFGVIIFLILIGVNQNIVLGIVKPVYKLLGKIKIFKNVDEKINMLVISVNDFHEQFKMVRNEKLMILKMSIFSILQHTAYYTVTYMVYRAFGNSGASVFNIIPAQAFLMMIMAFAPIPGAGVAAEGGFLLIFNSLFKKGTINMAILFWRMFTFYLPIIVGSLFLLVNRKGNKQK